MCRAFVSARSELKYAIILSPFTFFLSLSTGIFLDVCPLILVTVQSLWTGGNGVEVVRPAMAPRVFCPPVHWQLANHRKSAEGAGGVFRFCLQTRALGFSSFCPPGCLSTAIQNRGRARWLSARHPALSPRYTSHEEAAHGRYSELSATRPCETPRPGSRGRRTSPRRARGPASQRCPPHAVRVARSSF